MLRKKYFILLSAIGVVLLSTVLASAQIVNITGVVELEKEDGTKEPVSGALVEIYDVATSAGSRKNKTNGKGAFSFVGVKPGATYIITVSGEGLEPVIIPGLAAGSENKTIAVRPGNGATYTEDEVRNAVSNPSSGDGNLTEEQKKALEEEEKKIAELKAKNEKAEKFNEVINRVSADGQKAFNAKDYDLAITTYTEGYEAGKDFLGSAPGFLNNIGVSYKARAIENHNASVKSSDAATKNELKEKAKTDFQESLKAFSQSVNLINTGDRGETTLENLKTNKTNALEQGIDVIGLMGKFEYASEDVKDDAIFITNEYVKEEKDKQKNVKAQSNAGRFLTLVYDYDGSVEAYRKALEIDPNDADALAGISLSLYTASEINGNTEQKQEGLNYMQYYLDKAPKDHPFRDSIEGLADELKSQKMKPQKIFKN